MSVRCKLTLICFTIFFTSADQNMLAPNLSRIGEEFGYHGSEIEKQIGSNLAIGFFVVGAPMAVIIGVLVDRYNRVQLLAGVVIIGECACLSTFFVRTYFQLMVTRTLSGVTVAGLMPVVYSLFSDWCPKSTRVWMSTAAGLAATGGVACGQLLAGLLNETITADSFSSRTLWRLPFLLVAIPSLVCGLIITIALEEPVRGCQDTEENLNIIATECSLVELSSSSTRRTASSYQNGQDWESNVSSIVPYSSEGASPIVTNSELISSDRDTTTVMQPPCSDSQYQQSASSWLIDGGIEDPSCFRAALATTQVPGLYSQKTSMELENIFPPAVFIPKCFTGNRGISSNSSSGSVASRITWEVNPPYYRQYKNDAARYASLDGSSSSIIVSRYHDKNSSTGSIGGGGGEESPLLQHVHCGVGSVENIIVVQEKAATIGATCNTTIIDEDASQFKDNGVTHNTYDGLSPTILIPNALSSSVSFREAISIANNEETSSVNDDAQQRIPFVVSPSLVLLLLQGVPGCLPWGMIYVFLNQYLETECSFDAISATLAATIFTICGAIGQVIGGIIGQKLFDLGPRKQCYFISATTLAAVLPLLIVINICSGKRLDALFLCVALAGLFASIAGPNVRALLQVRMERVESSSK